MKLCIVPFFHFRNGKVVCNEFEQSSVKNIYAIGDILDGKLELTPVAIQAGIRLVRVRKATLNRLLKIVFQINIIWDEFYVINPLFDCS